ncbi:MAG: tyrosinase family protein [Alphaproteobacteria bacterium]|nr:tyrosinase family protein [Alphaproteobacteria bacterium]
MLRRRELLLVGAAFGASGVHALGSEAPVIRSDVRELSPERLARFEAAVGEMQRRSRADPDDPSGWQAHALGHMAVCSVANGDQRQVHGCWWFLPWHRAFLAVTEWKLRAVSGDPTLALPYWNWSSERAIPAAFARTGSPLAAATRYTPQRALRPAEVDYLAHDPSLAALGVAALDASTFCATTHEQIPASFGGVARPNPAGWHGRSRLESVPHDTIHNYVGGESQDGTLGDMTELGTAALDPLFYAHHANIDRLWEIWRRDPGRRASEPGEPAFSDQAFVFPWTDGSPLTVTVGQTLDTARLGYAYRSLEVFGDGTPPGPVEPVASPSLAAATLPVPPGSGRAELGIEGVEPTERPITVEIEIARTGAPETAMTVGALAIGRRHSDPVYPDTEPRFDITAALARLRASVVTATVRPLRLGPEGAAWPSFRHSDIVIRRTT